MEIKFLKAGTGDSILIHHKAHNILIDGGNESKYLLDEMDKIYSNNEFIDLLVITHHDDDHIKGIIDLLDAISNGKYGAERNFVKKVIFNSPKLIAGKIKEKENQLSYKQAHDVENVLLKLNLEWKLYIEGSEALKFEDLTIDFLSPTKEDLDKYTQNKGAYLSSDFKCDWKTPISILEKYIDDESQDKSIPNKSSVVMKVECEGKKVLLTADVTPERLAIIIDKLVFENKGNRVLFDYIKLPHHGSYRSLNRKIIENISCNKFIISTNSKKHFLPNKRALLKLIKFLKRDNDQIIFLFNYEEALNNLEITEKEKKDNNIILAPNNQKYGIII